jgi:hypothetical protein
MSNENLLKIWFASSHGRKVEVAQHCAGVRVQLYQDHYALSFGHGSSIDSALGMAIPNLPNFVKNMNDKRRLELMQSIAESERLLAIKKSQLSDLEK